MRSMRFSWLLATAWIQLCRCIGADTSQCVYTIYVETLEASAYPVNCSLSEVTLSNTSLHHAHRGALLLVTTDIASVLPTGPYFSAVVVKLLYCKLHKYRLYIYVGHNDDLPPSYPPHFHKIPAIESVLRLGHPWVFFSDLDTFMIPSTAIPVHTIIRRPLTLQKELNLCSCALIFQNHPVAFDFLKAWWNAGATNCCTRHTFEQIAFKHVLGRWLQNYTVSPVYNLSLGWTELHSGVEPSSQHDFQSVDAPFVTFHGNRMNLSYNEKINPPEVQLHSCLSLWGGCIASDLPALLYHTGHWMWSELLKADTLTNLVESWKSVLDM
jgi:hypothetical protein